MQIYKNKNPYFRTLMVLSITRIVLCVLPLFVLVFLLWRVGSDFFIEGIIFAALIMGIIITYAALSRRYRILLSGQNGERALLNIIKHIKWSDEAVIFTNLPVFHNKNHSEIDMLLIGKRGILIIEVKNHSGAIIGAGNDDFWVQRKNLRENKSVEKKIINPINQLRRQRSILKNILRENGFDLWIENALFFSNPGVRLRLELGKTHRTFSDKEDLINYINTLKSQSSLSKTDVHSITKIILNLSKSQ